MERRAAIAALLVGGATCGGPAAPDREPVVLRVSAVHGVSQFAVGPGATGSTAYALDLVYDPLTAHVDVVGRDGARVALRRLPTTPHSTAALAAALRFDGLLATRVDGDEIECQLADATAAAAFVELPAGFDLGPFTLADQVPGRIHLSPRGPSALDAIDILALDGDEEWRRLLAREIDVVPNAAALYRGQLAGIGSLRTIDLPVGVVVALLFDTADPALSDPAVRRAVARAIDVAAVARVACGADVCAVSWWPVAEADGARRPARLSLLALDTSPAALAAGVVRHQLRAAGVEVVMELVPVDELRVRCQAGHFQLAVLTLPAAFEEAAAALAGSRLPTGYRSEPLERALAGGDVGRARSILATDVPALPLHELRQFAAVDGRFCGGRPEAPDSWRWLSELAPCAEEEHR